MIRAAVAGYLLADLVDGCAHVEQVSVHPRHVRRRLGAALVGHLAGWSQDRGLLALTLTTYRHVPWNGPYYRSLGFRSARGHRRHDDAHTNLDAMRQALDAIDWESDR